MVELSQAELKRNARAKRSPLRMVLSALFFAGVMFTVMTVIYSQVQLTELTEEINQTTQALEEAESLEIQLNMAAAQKMTGAQVEEYAVNELGMSKITGSQVTYVNVAQEDQGTVVRRRTARLCWIRSWRRCALGLPERTERWRCRETGRAICMFRARDGKRSPGLGKAGAE